MPALPVDHCSKNARYGWSFFSSLVDLPPVINTMFLSDAMASLKLVVLRYFEVGELIE